MRRQPYQPAQEVEFHGKFLQSAFHKQMARFVRWKLFIRGICLCECLTLILLKSDPKAVTCPTGSPHGGHIPPIPLEDRIVLRHHLSGLGFHISRNSLVGIAFAAGCADLLC